MKVKCDECKENFMFKKRTKKIKDDIKKIYFICPSCKKEYVAYYTNNLIEERQKELSKLLKSDIVDNDKYDFVRNDLTNLIDSLKLKMEEK